MAESLFAKEPLAIGGVLDAGIKLIRSTYVGMLPTAALAAIPYALISSMINSAVGVTPGEVADPEQVMADMGTMFMLMPLMYVALSFLLAAITHRGVMLANGAAGSLAEDMLEGAKKMIPLTLLMIGFILAVGLGSLLLLIPGLILAVTLCLFFYVPFMEPEQSIWSSLRRSHQLVWGGNWWRTLLIVTVITILGMVLSMLFYLVIGAIAVVEIQDGASTGLTIMEFFAGWLSMLIYMPFFVCMSLALYNDLRLRKEGGDLDARLEELET